MNTYVNRDLQMTGLFPPDYTSATRCQLVLVYFSCSHKYYRPVFFYKLHSPHGMPTFKTEALRLVSNGNVQLFKCLLLQNKWQIQRYFALLWQEFMMRFITKAPPISFIDSKCHTV